jgi:hypothetical protein
VPDGFLARLRAWTAQRNRPDVLLVTDEGLVVDSPRERRRVGFAWAQVEEVVAFKRDEWSTDLICLDIHVVPDGWYLVHEGMEGFDVLVDRLPALLPGTLAHREWFPVVAFPPFARNPTVIFARSP